MTLDYLIIGHITKDILSDGTEILGGTCAYSSYTASKLDVKVKAITSYGQDIPNLIKLKDVDLINHESMHSTTFMNIYDEYGNRVQRSLHTAKAIAGVFPLYADVIHLAPVFNEFSPAVCETYCEYAKLLCVTPQGWLRSCDENGEIHFHQHPLLEQYLKYINIMVMSLDDVAGDKQLLKHYLTSVDIGVQTLGSKGCIIHKAAECTYIDTIVRKEQDPTGAGDVFAAAFFVHYSKTKDINIAAVHANSLAGASVKVIGLGD